MTDNMISRQELMEILVGSLDFYESKMNPAEHHGDYAQQIVAYVGKGLIQNAIEYVQNMPSVGGWISCAEKLPEPSEPILIVAGNGHRVTAYYDSGHDVFRLTEDENLYYTTDTVTHWMPIPEVPQSNVDVV